MRLWGGACQRDRRLLFLPAELTLFDRLLPAAFEALLELVRLLLTAAPELLAPLLARRPRSRLVPEEVPVRDAVGLVDRRRVDEEALADLVAALAEPSVAPVPEPVRVTLSLMVRPSPARSTSRRLPVVQPFP